MALATRLFKNPNPAEVQRLFEEEILVEFAFGDPMVNLHDPEPTVLATVKAILGENFDPEKLGELDIETKERILVEYYNREAEDYIAFDDTLDDELGD